MNGNCCENANNITLPPCGGRWKGVVILGDGMADHAVERLGNRTPMMAAETPTMDFLAKNGRCGRLITVPEGFPPGSEVANTAIMGYDLNKVYEGRGPLEAASIGYEMEPDDLAIRCNIITLLDGKIVNHHGGHLTTEEGRELIEALNKELGNDRIKFIAGIQYRHLLIIKGGNKHVKCAPPHDHPGEEWEKLMPAPLNPPLRGETDGEEVADSPSPKGEGRGGAFTASLFRSLILKSQKILSEHPLNKRRVAEGKLPANSIWMWSGGYRPQMETLMDMFPRIKSGAVISAVDLIRGIGHYAGLEIIEVEGATGLADTNYEGKARAAIEALKTKDFVFLHVEASDEAGHDGDLDLKIKTIEYLDRRIIKPIYDEVSTWDEPVSIAVLPDHPTPVEQRIHVSEPVPFLIYYKGIEADGVDRFDEVAAVDGHYGLLRLEEFIKTFVND